MFHYRVLRLVLRRAGAGPIVFIILRRRRLGGLAVSSFGGPGFLGPGRPLIGDRGNGAGALPRGGLLRFGGFVGAGPITGTPGRGLRRFLNPSELPISFPFRGLLNAPEPPTSFGFLATLISPLFVAATSFFIS